MTQTVGYYILLGVIGLFAVGSLVLIIMVVLTNRREAKSKTEQLAQPQQASLAETIQKQFQETQVRKERLIHTKSGVTRAVMKETKSAFSFQGEDDETGISLDSEAADNDKGTPFV